MQPEEFIRSLLHADQPYDPAKAHEYYLRTRKLKGRHHGAQVVPIKSQRLSQISPAEKERRKKALKAQVDALQAKLVKLQKVLSDLTSKVNEGKSNNSSSSSKKKPTHHLTAAQKAKRAAARKKYEEKHKNQSLAEQAKELTAKIKKIQAQIKLMRAELAKKNKAKHKKAS